MSVQLLAQSGTLATISGAVVDPDGKVVPAASVSIKNDFSAAVRTITTDSAGRFEASGLPVGSYTIEVTAPGFKTARSAGLRLAANGLENISVALTVAGVSEEATVSEFLPLAATLAPSQSSLDARSAESVISPHQQRNWDFGLFSKRIGPQFNDNGSINQAIPIDPFEITNLYFNYTIKNRSEFSQTKIKLSVNNLTNNESIVGVPRPASTKSNLPAPGDILTILAGRSISLALTFGYSPHH
jgi:hypothetical protein